MNSNFFSDLSTILAVIKVPLIATLRQRGAGLIYSIKQDMPGVPVITVDDWTTADDIVRDLEKLHSQEVILDCIEITRPMSVEIINIFKAMLEGSLYARKGSTSFSQEYHRIVIAATTADIFPESVLERAIVISS